MRPSEALARNIDAVREIIARYPVTNPRIFGSAARGEDTEGSDLDMLVDPSGPFSYFEMAKLSIELESLLGCQVDLGTTRSLRVDVAAQAAQDSRPL